MSKKTLLIFIVLITLALQIYAFEIGVVYGGDMHGSNNSFVGISTRSRWFFVGGGDGSLLNQSAFVGLEISAMPKIGPQFDMSSWRFIVAPSIGVGIPDLSIFASISPHIELVSGKLEFEPQKWGFGAGSTFVVMQDVLCFYEMFVEFDFSGKNDLESLTSSTSLNIGVSYNFDIGF